MYLLKITFQIFFLNFDLIICSVAANAEYLRKLMTKITLKDVLSKVQVQEQVVMLPIRHMRYDLTLHLLPHRCYESTTHETPKTVMKFIKRIFPDILKKMFVKNLLKNLSGELISEQAKQAIKLNREQNETDDAVIVSIYQLLYIKILSDEICY